jgi:alkanesulfonate monooxygenase SsuD/methylene tetrahydromethanopterin reductase-like flavin-dependent oxidoreductase (luciferase family)
MSFYAFFSKEIPMTVDFGIRLPRYPDDPAEDAHAYYERTLNSLSEHITTVWLSDHLQDGDEPNFESWVLMAHLAGLYPRFTFSHLVNCQSYRNPALLAKMGATMQHLTNGKFILSLGAGWHKEEYDSYNFDFATPGARVEQLAETIEIVRALWTQSPATYHGKYYHIEDAYCSPQPHPIPPILVGTNGKKALAVAARLADAWNWDFSMSVFEPAYRVLKQECDAIGRDVGEIRLTLGGKAHFPKDPSEFVAADTTAADIVEAGYVVPAEPKLGPTPADAIEQLRPFVERGVRHFQIAFEDQRTIDTFCKEVAPQVAQM